MTHDELLAKIDTLEARYSDYSSYLALSAVVKLHRRDVRGNCDICTYITNGGAVVYPCFTIQAIEKELTTPNDYYGRSCQDSGHTFAPYQSTVRCIWCGNYNTIEVKLP